MYVVCSLLPALHCLSTSALRTTQDVSVHQLTIRRADTHVSYGVTIQRYTSGIHVTAVAPNSPADEAGLRVYDLIREVCD